MSLLIQICRHGSSFTKKLSNIVAPGTDALEKPQILLPMNEFNIVDTCQRCVPSEVSGDV